ncbi:TolC family protein [Arcobacter vandammei]|uniref:TolC family protein n=1 Tax=Arcobacter vandammei TaxID=2782243 RepID=UPI0018DF6EB9
MKKIYFSFFVPLFLYSQNLDELVNLSIENKLVNASVQNMEAVKEDYKSVQSGYLPKLDVGAGYFYTEKETASAAQQRVNAYGSLNYLLYDGGKKSDIYNTYENSIKSSEKSIEALKNDISLNVINYYFNYLSLLSKKETKIQEITELNAQKDRISRFFDAGTTTEDELQKIISNLENANVTLQETELEIITILHNLEYITGSRVSITEGSVIELSNSNKDKNLRFDIQALEYDIKTKQSNANAEKSGYLPTVTLDNTFTYYDNEYKNKSFQNSVDHQNVASANMKWNLFSFGETKHKVESKQKEYLASKSKYEYEKNRADVDLQLAIKSYEIAKAKIKSTQANINAAQSAYDIIKSKFENGLIDNVAFLQSLTEKYDAISKHKTALNDLEIKKANIIYHSGEKLQEYIK